MIVQLFVQMRLVSPINQNLRDLVWSRLGLAVDGDCRQVFIPRKRCAVPDLALKYGQGSFRGIPATTGALADAFPQRRLRYLEIEDQKRHAVGSGDLAEQIALAALEKGGIDDDRPARGDDRRGERGQVLVGALRRIGGVQAGTER